MTTTTTSATPSLDAVIFCALLAGLGAVVLAKTKKLIASLAKLAVVYSLLVCAFGAIHVARRHGGDFDAILKGDAGVKDFKRLLHVIVHSAPPALFVCYLGGLITPKTVRGSRQ